MTPLYCPVTPSVSVGSLCCFLYFSLFPSLSLTQSLESRFPPLVFFHLPPFSQTCFSCLPFIFPNIHRQASAWLLCPLLSPLPSAASPSGSLSLSLSLSLADSLPHRGHGGEQRKQRSGSVDLILIFPQIGLKIMRLFIQTPHNVFCQHLPTMTPDRKIGRAPV